MFDTRHGSTIMAAEAGSRAYGVQTKESDYDYIAVFVAPMKQVATFGAGREALETRAEDGRADIRFYEISKACRLLLKGSFNTLPLLFSEETPVLSDFGVNFRANRTAFLSTKFVSSIFGFSSDVIAKQKDMNRFHHSDEVVARAFKKCSVAYRELIIARRLYQGVIASKGLKLDEDQVKRAHDIREGQFPIDSLERLFSDTKEDFKQVNTLPDEPDVETVQNLIMSIRYRFP